MDDTTLTHVMQQLEKLGTRQWCENAAREQVHAAEDALAGHGLHEEPCAALAELARFAAARQA